MGQNVPSATFTSLSGPPEPLLTLLGSAIITYMAYATTAALIPRLRNDFVAKGLKGIDMLKGYERDPQNGKLKGPELYVDRGHVYLGEVETVKLIRKDDMADRKLQE